MNTTSREPPESLRLDYTLTRALCENAHSLAILLDGDGIVVDLNPRAAEILGHSSEGLKGAVLWEHLPAERSAALKTAFRTVLEHGEEFRHDTEYRGRWYDSCWTPCRNGRGEVVGAAIVAWDITERKRAEQALAESQLMQRAILDSTDNKVWCVDPIEMEKRISRLLKEQQAILDAAPIGIALCKDRLVQWANPVHHAIHGYGSEELIGSSTAEFYVHAEDYERVGREACPRFKEGLIYTTEVEQKRKDGSHFWGLIQGRAIDQNDLSTGVIWMVIDVTDRKRAQQDLARNEAELAAIYDSSPLMMCLVNRQRYVERTNRAMAQFAALQALPESGKRPGDILRCVNALDSPDGCGAGQSCQSCPLRLAMIKTFDTGQPCRQIEATLVLDQGGVRREIQVSASTALVRSPDQPKVLVCLEDISQRKRLEAQFLQAQKMESVGQLAGGVAHDFNNILAATLMHLSLLRQNPSLDAETQDSLKELVQETQRAASLTRQLLIFSRRSTLEVKVLDLNELVANLLKMVGRLIGEHITVSFERHEPLPAVEADPGMIEQVLMNLALNGRDAMPGGGLLTISITSLEADALRVMGRVGVAPGLFVCLSVADTGCGMDRAALDHIFEPFFTTKEVGKGTGLGLATVHGIVSQHKGWVEVESGPGRGTKFTVFLPATAKTITELPAGSENAAIRGHETILLVEDAANLRRLAGRVLRRLGYEVFEADNGKAALTIWAEHAAEIELLFSDMVMPEGFTGLELAEKLRAEKPSLKVIITSGYNAEMAGDSRQTPEGMVYLQKPFRIEVMARTVRECLDAE